MAYPSVSVTYFVLNGKGFIKVVLPKEPVLIEKIKRIKGRQWSAGQKAWLLPYDKESWNNFQKEFKDTLYVTEKDGKDTVHNPDIVIPTNVYVKKLISGKEGSGWNFLIIKTGLKKSNR